MKLFDEIKQNFKALIKDRLMFLIVLAVFVAGIIFFFNILSQVQVYERLVYSRFTIFGGERFYKDAWFYRVAVACLGLFIAIFHPIIIAKFYKTSGRRMAILASIFSLIVVVLGLIIVNVAIKGIPN